MDGWLVERMDGYIGKGCFLKLSGIDVQFYCVLFVINIVFCYIFLLLFSTLFKLFAVVFRQILLLGFIKVCLSVFGFISKCFCFIMVRDKYHQIYTNSWEGLENLRLDKIKVFIRNFFMRYNLNNKKFSY